MAVLNIDNARSYATEDNLTKAIKNMGLDDTRHLVVRNRKGRWTAVFAMDRSTGGDAFAPARHGFIVFG